MLLRHEDGTRYTSSRSYIIGSNLFLVAPQNLDSSEISLTDVSHYFDSDPTKLVSGLRKDGKMPSSYIAGAPLLFRTVRRASSMACAEKVFASLSTADEWVCLSKTCRQHVSVQYTLARRC